MRKVIWCSTAAVVFGTAAVFLAAYYAAQHPASFLGRCAHLGYQLGVRCNPLVFVGNRAPDHREPVAQPGKPIADACFPIPEPEILGDEHQEPPLADLPPEVVEPIVVDAEDDTDDSVQAPPVQSEHGTSSDNARPDSPPAVNKDEEKLPPAMPYTDDDSKDMASLSDCACMSRVFRWVMQKDNTAGNGSAPSSPCGNRSLAQCIMDCLKQLNDENTGTGESAAVPADPVSNDESQENAAPHKPGAADLREDPNYHQQYPSCPYTGGCPYPHQYTVPKVQPTETPKTSPRDNNVSTDPDNVVHAEVDTMECRPTDLPVTDDGGPF
jgi:hypothetical protein